MSGWKLTLSERLTGISKKRAFRTIFNQPKLLEKSLEKEEEKVAAVL